MADTGPGCTQVQFDIPETAGLYSQLAGVLAGFSFAIFSFLMTQGKVARTQWDLTPRLSVSSFTTLVLTTLSYALLAGESENSGQAATIEVIAAGGFISAGMVLFQLMYQLSYDKALTASPPLTSILWLPTGSTSQVPTPAAKSTLRSLRFGLAFALPVVLVATLLGGFDDYSQIRYPTPRPPLKWHDEGIWNADNLICSVHVALVIVALTPIVTYLATCKVPWHHVGKFALAVAQVKQPLTAFNRMRQAAGRRGTYSDDEKRYRVITRFSRAVVLIGVTSTGACFYVSTLPRECDALPEWVPLATLAVATLFLCATSVHMIRTR